MAWIAPGIGSNVIRFRNVKDDMEIFRFSKDVTPDDIKRSPEVYGLPSLYLPNRLSGGRLKTTDAQYQLEVNEKDLGNFIHGFLHKREHTVVAYSTDEVQGTATVETEYQYDESDPYYQYLPIKFCAHYKFQLSKDGLHYDFTMTNCSNVQLPFGFCTHTTIMAPFTSDGSWEDTRLYVPIGEKWILNDKCIPTTEIISLGDHDKQYLTGSMVPVKHILNNDVYFAEQGDFLGEPLYGCVISDLASDKHIVYEVSEDYRYWVIWNDWGEKGYFCPEPMTWMIDAPNLNLPVEETGYEELAPGESKTVHQHFYTVCES